MANKHILFALVIIFVFINQSLTVNAENSTFQDDSGFYENRVISFERPTIFMFGEQKNTPTNEWDTWNHANNNAEQNSDDYFYENAYEPGSQNNGGGSREFTFSGCIDSSCSPNNETIPLIEGEFVTGSLILNIGCNSGNCRTDVSITLTMDGRDLQSIYMESANDESNDDKYNFIFDQAKFTENVIPANAQFDVRISFQKPGGLGDFYYLYLKEEFTISFPILPEVVYPIPESDFNPIDGNWNSPYSASDSGFIVQSVESNSIIFPIIFFVILTTLLIIISIFTPDISFKIPAVLLLIFTLIIPILIAPIISYVQVNQSQNTDSDPSTYSIADLIGMQTQQGSFIGDLMPEDNFNLWIDNSYVYKKSLENSSEEQQLVYGLGFENYRELIENEIDSSKHGRMILQLYFSMLEIDPSKGSGVMLNITLVNDSAINQIVPDFATLKNGNKVFIKEGNPRWVVPEESITIIGEKVSWRLYPLLGLLPSLGLLSYGIYIEYANYRLENEDEYLDVD